MRLKKMLPVGSFSDLYQRADGGDERYQKLCIVALNNLGCDHLANSPKWKSSPKWKAYFHGLKQYVEVLVSEYGETDGNAEKSVLEEINNVRDCIEQADLNWGKK